MTERKLVTIAIPSYQNFKQLVDCLWTLTQYTEFPYKIVVINNGSPTGPDGQIFEHEIRRRVTFPDLHFIQAEENLGWQKAINRAFEEHCDTEYFCMANDDLIFHPNETHFWWKLLHAFQHQDVGAVGPMTNYVMGAQNHAEHRAGSAICETTLLIGFLMAVRSKAFSEVGGLDEGLIGGDDLDLSMLLRQHGYRLIINRNCYVHHIGSQTGPRVTPADYWNSQKHIEYSNNTLIRKHGVKAWYNCIMSRVRSYDPITQQTDVEGDLIRATIGSGKEGLDVGCGGNKTIPSAIGIDQQAPGERGHAGGRKNNLCVADVVADITDLPFPDNSKDYIVARHVFEHLVDPVMALDEWHRVLKPGGTLAVACPDENVTDTLLIDWSHKHAYTPASLRHLAGLTGFEIESEHEIRPGISFVTFLRKAA